MKSRRLGRSGLAASEIGFGAWAVGGSCRCPPLFSRSIGQSQCRFDGTLDIGVCHVAGGPAPSVQQP